MSLTNPRFAGDAALEACASGGATLSEPATGLAVRKVQWALIDLGFDLPVHGADGQFGPETATAVSLYKVSHSIAPSDGMVGPRTMNALDAESLPGMDQLARQHSDRRSFYTNRALSKAQDAVHPAWDPAVGFLPNRPRIVDVYNYYRDLYNAAPLEFLWAGLGRMAGGAVVGGMDSFPVGLPVETVMVRIGRDIFFDLAWLHEAYLDHPSEAIRLGHLHDRFNELPVYSASGTPSFAPGFSKRSYGAAFDRITVGAVVEGNRAILENEQFSIIQPHYDFLLGIGEGDHASAFVSNIHPYHRDFLVDIPSGNVFLASDRWNWIALVNGMYQRWDDIGVAERERLANLSFDDTLRRQFGPPGRPDLLPPGGP